jgi:hypothetical protein
VEIEIWKTFMADFQDRLGFMDLEPNAQKALISALDELFPRPSPYESS